MTTSLTPEQYRQLAAKLQGTHRNIYELCSEMFGHAADDTDFERLKEVTGVFHCDECGGWFEPAFRSPHVDLADFCVPCEQRIYIASRGGRR